MVVIGGGNSGVCAALAAAEAGASVAVVEVQAEADYTFLGHDIGRLNSNWSHEHGGDVIDEIEFVQDRMRRNMNRTNPLLVRQFAAESGKALDWILSHAGFGHHRELRHFRRSEAHSLPRRDFRLSVCMQRATAVADASPCSTAPLSPVSASGGPPPWARSSARPWRRCNSFTQPSPQRPPRISAGAFVGKAFSALKVGAVAAGDGCGRGLSGNRWAIHAT